HTRSKRDWSSDVCSSDLDGFTVVADDDPVEPDHGLPDEADWWHSTRTPPDRLLAVRDLDLVADDAWPEVLRALAGEPDTWRALKIGRASCREGAGETGGG